MPTRPIKSIRDVATLVRGRRRELGLSQAELASRAGVSRQWVSAFEVGKPGAELRLVLALLEALDLRLSAGEAGDARDRPGRPPGDEVDLDALIARHRGP